MEDEVINTNDGNELLKYADVDKCWLCYNLVKPVLEIKAENPCCMKFAIDGRESLMCSNEPTESCTVPMKEILNKMHGQCKAQQPNEAAEEPTTCGTDEDYKEQAEIEAATGEANSPESPKEAMAKLLEDLLANMPTNGADQAAAVVGEMAGLLSDLGNLEAISAVMTPEGLLITNADGSTTL